MAASLSFIRSKGVTVCSTYGSFAEFSAMNKKPVLLPASSETWKNNKNDLGTPQTLIAEQQSPLSFQQGKPNHQNRKMPICIPLSMRWWDKVTKPNMIDIKSAKHFVDSLLEAGDKLVVVEFFSPGCGGCRTLHPKVCQLAESKPDAVFLKVNYEELKEMCYSLNIHVLPFFKLYRGAEGCVSSFSCTTVTINKFKKALAKHGTNRCSLGPARGLEEHELLRLPADGEINLMSYPASMTSARAQEFIDLKSPNVEGRSLG